MEFDTKLKVILRDDLEPWQQLNVCAFLMSGIAATQDIVGEPYRDADGVEYLPMSQQPIVILSATGDELSEVLKKVNARGDIAMSIYTRGLFDTFNDEDNRAEVASHPTDDLDLAGVAIRGKRNAVDRITKHLSMHR